MASALPTTSHPTTTTAASSSSRFNTIQSVLPRHRTTSTTSTSIESLFTPETTAATMKSRATASVWSNDGDPFAAVTTAAPRRSNSLRASSPFLRKAHPASAKSSSQTLPPPISTTGIAGGSPSVVVKKHQRMSLLVTASDALFSRSPTSSSSSPRRASVLWKHKATANNHGHYVNEMDQIPVVDIRGAGDQTDEEAEREALRNEAAKSVGLSLLGHEEDASFAEVDEFDVHQSQQLLARRPSIPIPLSPGASIDFHHAPYSPPPQHTSNHQQHLSSLPSSSAASLSGTIEQPQPRSFSPALLVPRSIPRFPATLSSLKPFIQNSSTLVRHYPGTSFFLSKSRQWKSRHLVLTTLKPTSSGTDTQSHLHLFRSYNDDEKELERMKIDEDSVAYVVDDGFGAGRKHVIRLGGLHAGGMTSEEKSKPSTMSMMGGGGLSAMSSPAMAISMGGQRNLKVLWLVQCPDAEVMHRWISCVKGALLVQRAERAGLSLQTSPTDARVTGDVDVLLSLRAQGLFQTSNNSPTTNSVPNSAVTTNSSSLSPSIAEDSNHNARSGRSRSSTNATATNPSSAVNALRGLFSASVLAGGNSNKEVRPRSSSASVSPVSTPPLSLVSSRLSTAAEEDPKDSSFGNRASALLNLSIQRATDGLPMPSSSSLLLNQSISSSIPPTMHDDDEEFDAAKQRELVRATYAAYERPVSAGSLPPPPRNNNKQQRSPRTPVLENSLQEELKKAMFAPVRGGDLHGRRSSTDTIPEDGVFPLGSVLVREPSVRTSIDGRGRVSVESTSEVVPFPATVQVPQFAKSSASFGVDLQQQQQQQQQHQYRPGSAMSSTSTTSYQNQSPTTTNSSAATTTNRGGPSSPKRSRRGGPKAFGPPPAPPPSAPPPATPNLHPDDIMPKGDRGSMGTMFNSHRVSTNSSTGLSIRSFTSNGSTSSRGNPPTIPRAAPPPTFALPPTPSSPAPSDGSGSLSPHPFNGDTYASSLRTDSRIQQHRLTPPSAPPPTVALPPRPSSAGGHQRSSSTSTNGGYAMLSTIPASPPTRSTDLPGGGRLNSSPPPVMPTPRQATLKSRLRMLSSPSPRPPTQALPPLPVATVAPPIAPDSRPTTPDVERPIMMLGDLSPPAIPTRSQARPRSPRIPQQSSSSSEGEVGQRTLSPPPRRGSRQSRDLTGMVMALPRSLMDADIAALDVASVSERADQWEPSIRESGILL